MVDEQEAKLNSQEDLAKLISLTEAASFCPYSQEYLSLLARRGLIGAKKLGRNWVISKEVLFAYVEKNSEVKSKRDGTYREQAFKAVVEKTGLVLKSPKVVAEKDFWLTTDVSVLAKLGANKSAELSQKLGQKILNIFKDSLLALGRVENAIVDWWRVADKRRLTVATILLAAGGLQIYLSPSAFAGLREDSTLALKFFKATVGRSVLAAHSSLVKTFDLPQDLAYVADNIGKVEFRRLALNTANTFISGMMTLGTETAKSFDQFYRQTLNNAFGFIDKDKILAMANSVFVGTRQWHVPTKTEFRFISGSETLFQTVQLALKPLIAKQAEQLIAVKPLATKQLLALRSGAQEKLCYLPFNNQSCEKILPMVAGVVETQDLTSLSSDDVSAEKTATATGTKLLASVGGSISGDWQTVKESTALMSQAASRAPDYLFKITKDLSYQSYPISWALSRLGKGLGDFYDLSFGAFSNQLERFANLSTTVYQTIKNDGIPVMTEPVIVKQPSTTTPPVAGGTSGSTGGVVNKIVYVTGPAGPKGDQGIQGPAGAQGPVGANGPSSNPVSLITNNTYNYKDSPTYNGVPAFFDNLSIVNYLTVGKGGMGTAGPLNVAGSANFSNGTNNTFTVGSPATFSNNLTVAGNFTSASAMTLDDDLYVAGKIGIGTTTPAVSLDIYATDAIRMPVGTTLQQPNGEEGMMRFNSDTLSFEGYNGSAWGAIGGAAVSIWATSTVDASDIYYTAGNVGVGTSSPYSILSVSTPGQLASTTNLFTVASTTGASLFTVLAGGNVGIGTADPDFKLDVSGIVNATALYVNGSPYIGSQWTTSGDNIYFATGTVGIGTSTLIASVAASSTDKVTAIFDQQGASDILQLQKAGVTVAKVTTDGLFGVGTSTPFARLSVSSLAQSSLPLLTVASTTNATLFTVLAKGNVGIGTVTPNYSLEITATDALKLPVGNTGERPTAIPGLVRFNSQTNTFEGYNNSAWSGLGGLIDLDQDTYILAESAAGVNENSLTFVASGTQRAIIDTKGRMGVGTSSAVDLLAQFSASSTDYVTAIFDQRGAYDILQLQDNGTTVFKVADGGKVGVGVAVPSAWLHLQAGTTAVGTAPLKFTSGDLLTAPEAGAIEFNNDKWYGTITTGVDRQEFAFSENVQPLHSNLTSLAGLNYASTSFVKMTGANTFTLDTSTYLNGGLGLLSSASLASALSDETGTVLAVFNTAPTIYNPVIANINPGADFTLTQNTDKIPFTSVNVGAVTDTLYLKAGNVGVGTTTPWATLAVNPVAGGASNQFVVGSSTATNFVVDNAGRVGVGTSTPTLARFTASSTNLITALFDQRGASDILQLQKAGSTVFRVNKEGMVGIGTSTPYSILSVSTLTATSSPLFTVASTTNETLFTVLANGNAGFGTTTPYSVLSVSSAGQLSSTTKLFTVASTTGASLFNVFAGGEIQIANNSWFKGVTSTPTGIGNILKLNTSDEVEFGSNISIGGYLTAPDNFGAIYLFNADVTSAASAGTVESASFGIDGTALLTLYSESNGAAGGIQNERVGIGTTTPFSTLSVSSPQATSSPVFTVASSTNATLMTILANGNVGIGTTTPFATLAVNPIAGMASNQFVVGSSTATNFIVTNTGRVGISTTTPSAKFHVESADLAIAKFWGSQGSAISGIEVRNLAGYAPLPGIQFYAGNTAVPEGQIYTSASTIGGTSILAGLNFSTGAAGQHIGFLFGPKRTVEASMILHSNGNVGIGTTTPALQWQTTIASSTAPQLSLSAGAGIAQWIFRNAGGNLYFATTTVAGTATSTLSALSLFNTGEVQIGNNSWFRAIDSTGVGSDNILRVNSSDEIEFGSVLNMNGYMTAPEDFGAIYLFNAPVSATPVAGTAESVSIGIDYNSILTVYSEADNAGGVKNMRVGIGTTTPYAKLAVHAGATEIYQSTLFSVASSTTAYATSTLFTVLADGQTSIGTTTIASALAVSTASQSSNQLFAVASTTGTNLFNILASGYTGVGSSTPLSVLAVSTPDARDATTKLFTVASTTGQILFNVGADGGVMIPAGSLCVDGDGSCIPSAVAGTINALHLAAEGGSDVAENYPSVEKLEKGDLVMADPNNEGYIIKTTGSYNNNVIGVISEDPGLLMGASVKGYPVALVGRIPTKVTAQNGAIKAGDTLTIAPIPGYAMKLQDGQAGLIIGTALANFDGSTGETGKISMFVNTDYKTTFDESTFGQITDGQIATNASINDSKLAQIVSAGKIAMSALPTGLALLQGDTQNFLGNYIFGKTGSANQELLVFNSSLGSDINFSTNNQFKVGSALASAANIYSKEINASRLIISEDLIGLQNVGQQKYGLYLSASSGLAYFGDSVVVGQLADFNNVLPQYPEFILNGGDLAVVDDLGVGGGLFVAGNLRVAGVAEFAQEGTAQLFSTTGEILEGEIAVADSENAGQVKRSFNANAQNILGVVATSAAQIFGSSDGLSNPKPVIISGMTRVKVSAVNGPIKSGDKLTTADTAGVAMLATRPGAGILGLAMEDLNEGEGLLKVFVEPGVYFQPLARIVTVGESGADFKNIIDALNSITDNAPNLPYIIKVAPGTYNEKIVLKDYVSIVGEDKNAVLIAGASSPLVTSGVNTRLESVTLRLSGAENEPLLLSLSGVGASGTATILRDISLESETTNPATGMSLTASGADVKLSRLSFSGNFSQGVGMFGAGQKVTLSDSEIIDINGKAITVASGQLKSSFNKFAGTLGDIYVGLGARVESRADDYRAVENFGLFLDTTNRGKIENSYIDFGWLATAVSGSPLMVDVSAGSGYVNGVKVSTPVASALTVLPNSTNYLFMNDEGSVSMATTTLNVGKNVLIAQVETDASTIVKIVNDRRNEIVVAKEGGQFVTINDAINSIAIASSGNRWTINVRPGVYVEPIIMKPFIDIVGSGDSTVLTANNQTVVTADFAPTATSTIITAGATTTPSMTADLKNLKVVMTGDAVGQAVVESKGADLNLENVKLEWSGVEGIKGVGMNVSGESKVNLNKVDISGSTFGVLVKANLATLATTTVDIAYSQINASENDIKTACFQDLTEVDCPEFSEGTTPFVTSVTVYSAYNILKGSSYNFFSSRGTTISSSHDTYLNYGGLGKFIQNDYYRNLTDPNAVVFNLQNAGLDLFTVTASGTVAINPQNATGDSVVINSATASSTLTVINTNPSGIALTVKGSISAGGGTIVIGTAGDTIDLSVEGVNYKFKENVRRNTLSAYSKTPATGDQMWGSSDSAWSPTEGITVRALKVQYSCGGEGYLEIVLRAKDGTEIAHLNSNSCGGWDNLIVDNLDYHLNPEDGLYAEFVNATEGLTNVTVSVDFVYDNN